MSNRPKKEETEEDILRQQQLFLSKKRSATDFSREFKPAATVIRSSVSSVKSERENESCDKKVESHIFDLKIIEKNVSPSSNVLFSNTPKEAFPKPVKLKYNYSEGKKTGRSIFLKEMSNKKSFSSMQIAQQDTNAIIDDSGLEKSAHIEMVNELLKTLKPSTIEFLKNRKKRTVEQNEQTNSEVKFSEKNLEVKNDYSEEELSHTPISISQVKENKWLNMDVVEKEKLEWMKPVEAKPISVSENVNARFNFDGSLITLQDQFPLTTALYNHGDEPERAGYSLNELLTFIQSSLPSQRVLGLQVTGNIMERAHKGFYDLIFTKSLQEELLSNTDILLIIRSCLDDSSDTIIAAAIHCLHGLVCNTSIDELYLDRMFSATVGQHFGYTPKLKPQFLEGKKLEDYTDSQLIREDCILGLLRTDILLRFRYLIEHYMNRQNDKVIIEKVFDILIRIARHSSETCSAIYDCPYFIETLMKNFLPAKIGFDESHVLGNPSSKALKLFRLMITLDSELQVKMFAAYPQLWDTLQVYLTIDPSMLSGDSKFSTIDVVRVLIESLRVWCVLMSRENSVGNEKFEVLFPMIIKQIQFCSTLKLFSCNTFDWHYASTLLRCVTFVRSSSEVHHGFVSIVKSVAFQWIRELINENALPSVDANIALSAALEYLWKNHSTHDLVANFIIPFLNNDALLRKFFSKLAQCSTLLLCNENEKSRMRRDAKCLPSFHCVYFGDKLQANVLFEEESIFSLFVTVVHVLNASENSLVQKFLTNALFLEYVERITKHFTPRNLNYCETVEIAVLALVINNYWLNTTTFAPNYHNLALNILCFVENKSLKENLIQQIIFNESIYKKYLNVNFLKLKICDREENSEEALELLPQVKEIYQNSTSFDDPLWIYDPIFQYFTLGNGDVAVISKLLHYYLILLKYNESYFSNTASLNVHFVKIATVFLFSNDVFFEQEVQHCLLRLLKKLLNLNIVFESSSEFYSKSSTFMSFFEEFVNHFEFASYGNNVFVNYLLVFLQQSCDKAFKKKIFLENPYALRAIFIPLNDLCFDVNKLLFPIETDHEIIELYLRNLLSRIVTPEVNKLIYLISIHHIHHSLFRNATHLKSTQPKKYEKLVRSIEITANVKLREHITGYSHHDMSVECGFVWNN